MQTRQPRQPEGSGGKSVFLFVCPSSLHKEDSIYSICKVLVRLFSCSMWPSCLSSPSSPLPWSPIPWGKVPSKNLLGHWDLIGSTPRPASHWPVELTWPQNYFEAESPLDLLLHLGARRRRYLSWKLYLKLYLSWKLLNIGFHQQTRTAPARGLQPHKSRPLLRSNIFCEKILFKFCSFESDSSDFRLRIEHVPLHIIGKSRERDFSRINFVFVESNFSNLMQMWGKCVKQTAGICPWMDWVHLLGHLLGRTKKEEKLRGLIKIFVEYDELKAWKGEGEVGKAELDFSKAFFLLFEDAACYRGGRRKCLRPCTAVASTLLCSVQWLECTGSMQGIKCKIVYNVARGRPSLGAETVQTLRCIQVCPLCTSPLQFAECSVHCTTYRQHIRLVCIVQYSTHIAHINATSKMQFAWRRVESETADQARQTAPYIGLPSSSSAPAGCVRIILCFLGIRYT